MYSVETVTPEELTAIQEALPEDVYVTFEQTGMWVRAIMDRNLREVYGCFVVRDGETVIATMYIARYKRQLRESLATLDGPVFAVERTPEVERAFVEAFLDYVRKDPSVDPLYVRMQLQHPSVIPGATPSIERGIFEREVLVEVEGKDAETLKKSYSQSPRQRINKGGRQGVEVREITQNRAEVFAEQCYPIMVETAERDGFSPLPLSTFEMTLDEFPEHTRLYVAYAPETDDASALEDSDAKIPVGWMISNEFHGRGCYYLSASSRRAQKTNAMYVCMHRVLSDLAANGNKAVGMTGIGSERWPELASLEGFKTGFSKNIVELPRLFDIPLNAPRYRAVRAVLLTRQEGPAKARALMQKAKALPAQARELAQNKELPAQAKGAARKAAQTARGLIGRASGSSKH